MPEIPKWRRYLRFWGPDVDSDVRDELDFHLEMRTRELIDEGWPPTEARDEALRVFGNLDAVGESCREIGELDERERRRIRVMDELSQDLRYGLRILVKQPGFTLVAVATLALGLGANMAILSFVHAILLRPLPFPDADRLVTLAEVHPDPKRVHGTASMATLKDWEAASKTVRCFGAWRDWRLTLQTADGPLGVRSAIATPGLFEALQVKPALGRVFRPEEDRPGANQVVLLSHGFWQRQFGGDPGIVGKSLTLGDKPFEVVGILPKQFNSPSLNGWDVWAPQSIDPDHTKGRWLRNRRIWARLENGASIEDLNAEMDTIASQLAAAYPETNEDWGVKAEFLHEAETGRVRLPLMLFAGAVGFVLLIACINVANLLLARGRVRHSEIALREALGAGRHRIARQLLTESLLLSVLGGIAGMGLAVWLTDVFIAMSPSWLPRLEEVRVSGAVFLFALLLSVASGVLFGITPSLVQRNLNDALKEGQRSSQGLSRSRLGSALLISEVALAIVLLTGAGLLLNSFIQMQTAPKGFSAENVLTFWVLLPDSRYPSRNHTNTFYRQASDAIASIPGVTSVGTASAGPNFGGRETVEMEVAGYPGVSESERPVARFFDVTPGYFRTLRISLRRGRLFNDHDDDSAPGVAIVNETMARGYWPGEDAIGKRISLLQEQRTLEVVGVVGDVREPSPGYTVEHEIYWPRMQQARWAAYFLIRSGSAPQTIVPEVRRRIAELDKDLILSAMGTLEERMDRNFLEPKFQLALVGSFACAALLLAAVGIYGVISYSIAQRNREIGVRIALGARRSGIFRLVVGRGMTLVLIGTTVGAIGSFWLTRLMESLLYGVSPTDPLTFLAVAVLVSAVALAACWIPAGRASRIDPIIALRSE